MTDRLDCVVIGAGVVGLAVARRLALAGRQVVVLEAETEMAMHTSSRNSEVIHAGIYYAPDSLKARLCVEGRERLYAYCEQRRIPHRRIGKLIVACDAAELELLQDYQARAQDNGVTDLRPLSAGEVAELEPAVCSEGGLLSPSTGIIDSHAFMMALRADLEAAEGIVLCRSRVFHIDITPNGFELWLQGEEGRIACTTLINSSGLRAVDLAARIPGFPREHLPPGYLAKGHYFSLQGPSPFSRLVYPVAGRAGLGVHVTLDINGTARFGPDVTWIDNIDYRFDETRKAAFVDAIRRYWPEVSAERLVPGYTGIRPKISGPGEPPGDFVVQGSGEHRVPELINLFGIESPGLTASLPLADAVYQALQDAA